MSVYLSRVVRDQLLAAQVQLDRHTAASVDGRCPACAEDDPCAARRTALHVFDRYERLPRRWPGASRPDQAAASGSWSGWLINAVDAVRSSD